MGITYHCHFLDVVATVDALTTNNDDVNIFYHFFSFLFFCFNYDDSLSIHPFRL